MKKNKNNQPGKEQLSDNQNQCNKKQSEKFISPITRKKIISQE